MSFKAHIKGKNSAYLLYILFDASLWTEDMREAKFVAQGVRLGVADEISVQLMSYICHFNGISIAYLYYI